MHFMRHGAFLVLGNRKPNFRNSSSYELIVSVYKLEQHTHIIKSNLGQCEELKEIRDLDQVFSVVNWLHG